MCVLFFAAWRQTQIPPERRENVSVLPQANQKITDMNAFLPFLVDLFLKIKGA